MQFENAYKGVKKIFIAELLSILAAVFVLAAASMSAFVQLDATHPLMIATGALILVGLGISIVSFVLKLVGLHQGGRDESRLKIGFYIVITAIVLTVVSFTLNIVNGATGGILTLAINLIDTLVDVSKIILIIYILGGIGNLALSLNDEFMANRSRFLINLVAILFVASILLSFVPSLIGNANEPLRIIFGVMSIVSALMELVAYILCVIHYGRAVKMLSK